VAYFLFFFLCLGGAYFFLAFLMHAARLCFGSLLHFLIANANSWPRVNGFLTAGFSTGFSIGFSTGFSMGFSAGFSTDGLAVVNVLS
jgi:hypothetical protein